MLADIPVNLVTGFLGAGKTTLIRHLLATRAAGARWAVLVNEFGEIGIDGALLAGDAAAGLFVKEVPGGCLCCANGLPMRIALNLLLQQAQPERLLVEPTGLGHPQQLLAQLEAPEYRGVLDLRATLCVVDPLALRDPRVAASEVFRQQLGSADVLVFNHADRAGAAAVAEARDLLASLTPGIATLPAVTVTRGAIDPALLDLPRRPAHWHLLPPPAAHDLCHAGARWPAAVQFPHDDTLALLLALPVRRLKAVLHTDRGWLEINAAPDLVDWRSRDAAADNRVEVITGRDRPLPDLQSILDSLRAGATG